jgi:hypothetical protein
MPSHRLPSHPGIIGPSRFIGRSTFVVGGCWTRAAWNRAAWNREAWSRAAWSGAALLRHQREAIV